MRAARDTGLSGTVTSLTVLDEHVLLSATAADAEVAEHVAKGAADAGQRIGSFRKHRGIADEERVKPVRHRPLPRAAVLH